MTLFQRDIVIATKNVAYGDAPLVGDNPWDWFMILSQIGYGARTDRRCFFFEFLRNHLMDSGVL